MVDDEIIVAIAVQVTHERDRVAEGVALADAVEAGEDRLSRCARCQREAGDERDMDDAHDVPPGRHAAARVARNFGTPRGAVVRRHSNRNAPPRGAAPPSRRGPAGRASRRRSSAADESLQAGQP